MKWRIRIKFSMEIMLKEIIKFKNRSIVEMAICMEMEIIM